MDARAGNHPDFGRQVLELGAGPGVAGLIAARVAVQTFVTDYHDEVHYRGVIKKEFVGNRIFRFTGINYQYLPLLSESFSGGSSRAKQ